MGRRLTRVGDVSEHVRRDKARTEREDDGCQHYRRYS